MRVLCFLICAVMLFSSGGSVLYAANALSSQSAVTRLKDVEKEKKELVKSLSKTYGAKVTAERWSDGNDYFILQRDNKYARADMDGNLIEFTFPDGTKSAFFFYCQYMGNGPENPFYALRTGSDRGSMVANIGLPDGRILTTANYSYASNIDGTVYLYHEVPNPNSSVTNYCVYTAGGELLNSKPGHDVRIVSPIGKKVRLSVDGDVKRSIAFKWPDMKRHMYATTQDNPVKYTIFGPEDGREREVDHVIGRLCATASASTDRPVKIYKDLETRRHYDSNAGLLGKDTVLSISFSMPVDISLTDGDEILARNVGKLWMINNSGVFYYEVTENPKTAHEAQYTGLVNLLDPSRSIPAQFADIAWDNVHNTAFVQESLMGEFEEYSPGKNYNKLVPSDFEKEMRTFAIRKHLSGNLDGLLDSISQLSPEEVTPLKAALIRVISSDMDWLEHNNFLSDSDIDPNSRFMKDTRVYYKDGEIISTFSEVFPRLKTYALTLAAYYDDPDFNVNIRDILTEAEILDMSSVAHFTDYTDRRLKRNAEIAEKNRKREQLAQALERSRKNREFVNEIQKYRSIIKEGEARQAAKKAQAAAASGKGASPVPASGSSSSEKADNAGRKGFLKGQIIEWKNKLKKAEAALQEQVASGTDDDWRKQRAVESKRRVVEECLEMIRGYEAELNSLK